MYPPDMFMVLAMVNIATNLARSSQSRNFCIITLYRVVCLGRFPQFVTASIVANFLDVEVTLLHFMQRWYVSGDVECFKGLHLPLALLAIAVVVACFLAIPFAALVTSRQVRIM